MSASEVSPAVTRLDVDRPPLRTSSPQQPGPSESKRLPVRVIVADSEAIFRVGMGKIFALEKDLEVVAQTENLQQTLNAVSTTPADIILFEAGLSPNPAESVTEIMRRAQPGTKIIIIAHFTGEEETVDYLRRGVRGILTRSISPDLLVRCVRKVATGETWLDNQGVNWVIEAYRNQAEHGVTQKHQLRLSEKEMLIIGGVTQGLKNKDIALEVGTTEQVVKNYLRKIYDKLGVSDRLELALYSMHRRLLEGYVPPPSREIPSVQLNGVAVPEGNEASASLPEWQNGAAKK
ncbi:MAG TPA: response regulator transcription factor [Candidatus Binatia bacterium]|nr:response regulator transcription factor [Candidatus Binatia bacterium]